MTRTETDLDPTYIRTLAPPQVGDTLPGLDPSVEDTILDPRLQSLPEEIQAFLDECAADEPNQTEDAQTNLGCLVPDEVRGLVPECEAPGRGRADEDEIYTVMGYEELPLPIVAFPPPPAPKNALAVTAGMRIPPQAETAVLPREMSELSMVAPLSFVSESRVPVFPEAPAPIPLELPPLVLEETREFERPISEPLVKAVSHPSLPPLESSDPAYRVRAFGSRISDPQAKATYQPRSTLSSDAKVKSHGGTPPSRPKVDVMPQRYIATVVSYPRPGEVRSPQKSWWSRFKAWFLPKQPGFVDAPTLGYYGAKAVSRYPAPAR